MVVTAESSEGKQVSMKTKHKIAATRTRRSKSRAEYALVGDIVYISKHIGAICEWNVSGQIAVFTSLGFKNEYIVAIVNTKVRKSVFPTNAMLYVINALLQTMVSKK